MTRYGVAAFTAVYSLVVMVDVNICFLRSNLRAANSWPVYSIEGKSAMFELHAHESYLTKMKRL